MDLYLEDIASPIGPLSVVTDGRALRAIEFDGYGERLQHFLRLHCGSAYVLHRGSTGEFGAALRAYFSGDVAAMDALPVCTAGTAFQRRVWEALREIPAGTTVSYGELARRVGAPKASRAVGLANGANPIPVVVPCHRVIGANGKLTGFGGGLPRKRWLLEHEMAHAGAGAGRGQLSMW